MNKHENQTMKIFGKRLTAGLLGAALVMSMPFASALTQKNITVERGVTVYVDDQKLNPGDANGNPVEPMLYNGTTYLPIRAVSAALNVPIAWDGTTSSAYLGEHKVDQNAVNRAKAYVSVIEQLQSKYGKRAVSGSIVSGLVTAMLIDFDGDGNEELLCVCNTKEKNAKGTNKHSTYMVYHWDGSKANCIAQHEVISPFSQNDPDYFKRTINIGERDGKKYLFWEANGSTVGEDDVGLISLVETVVDGQWKVTWGLRENEDWGDNGPVVWMTDYTTGENIDVSAGWAELNTWQDDIKNQYNVTADGPDAWNMCNPYDNLAPAPEIALAKLKAIANSQSSILGGKASGEYNAKRRMEKLAVETGVKVYVNDKLIVPTDVNSKTVDVLLYKGTTYLPVRAVANALDQAVAWDGASYSVYIGSHKDV